MRQTSNNKLFDLEQRTLVFASNTRVFVRKLPKTMSNLEDGPQLIRSSGSMGANYIEANESLSRRDFVVRIKICKKESKESIFWLNLIDTGKNEYLDQERVILQKEATELMKIFGSILNKTT